MILATTASGVLVAFQLAGRATRDALYLSTFPLATLPAMVMASAVVAAVACVVVSRRMARLGPARELPRLCLASAVLLLAEWALAGVARPATAVVLYLHFSALGALLLSGFWALVNESFDPRTARRAVARITVGATVGGLLGGLLPGWLGAPFGLTALLPVLAALHLVAALLVLGMRAGRSRASPGASPAMAGSPAEPAEPALPARQAFAASPYLRGLVLLVVLTAMAEGLLDFVFKARATAVSGSGEELLRLFARLYTVTALLAIVVQTVLLRPVLARLGLARSAALLPLGVSAGAVASFAVPGLVPVLLARGMEIVLRNSVFRGAYELLFTPVGAREKRATKLLVDVGGSRLGDAAGGALVQGTLAVAGGAAGQWLLAGVVGLSAAAALVARRLHRGYVQALERGLALPQEPGEAAGPAGETTLLGTFGGFEITRLAGAAGVERPARATAPAEAPAEDDDPARRRRRALDVADPATVRDALAAGPLGPALLERAIALLAWDEVAPAALAAIKAEARERTAVLVAHLLDPAEDFAVRRRLVAALAECPSPAAVAGLLGALADRRFEVRYRAGRALGRLRALDPGLAIDPERVLAVVLQEVAVERGVWESRRLIDVTREPWAPADAELVQRRAGRSMEHVFGLLALVLPREPMLLAYRGLHAEDVRVRGTALEYLESVLPERVRAGLWPFLEPKEGGPTPTVRSTRTAEEALDRLLASRESILRALEPPPRS